MIDFTWHDVRFLGRLTKIRIIFISIIPVYIKIVDVA